MNIGNDTSTSSVLDDGSMERFTAAKNVLTQRCTTCHDGSAATNFNLNSERDFINNGLVVAGSLSGSKVIYRTRNYTVNNGLQNMPPTGNTALTSAEYAILTNWVSNIGSTSITNQFTCNANEEPTGLDARKLTKKQVYNSMRDLLSRAIGSNEAVQVLANSDLANRIPADATFPYSSSDTNFSAIHARALFDSVDVVAKAVVATANYSRFVSTYINYARGACTYTDPSVLDQTCRTVLAQNFLLRAWGRPAESTNENLNNEVSAMITEFSLNGSTQAGFENFVYRTLMSPEFLFHVQMDVKPSGSYYRLSSHLIARRLAFVFTQSLPDENLLKMANDQDLLSETGFAAAVDYLGNRMDPMVDTFTREWLNLSGMPRYKQQDHPKYTLITEGLTADENLRTAMTDEVAELVSYVAKNNKPIGDLLTTNISFARNPSLMRIYNQTTAAPTVVTDANAVRFPAGERTGLLTRAALLFSGGHTENPVLRGIHMRKQMLCLTLASPPANIADQVTTPVADPNLTTRERYHIKTSPTACVGCHSQINPIGFAFSKYNAFGAVQLTEPIFDGGTPPQLTRTLATDSRADLNVALGVNKSVVDGNELSAEIPKLPQFKKCISQNLHTYVQGLSALPTSTTSCSMNRIYQTIETSGNLQDIIKSSVRDTRFRYRKIAK